MEKLNFFVDGANPDELFRALQRAIQQTVVS